jgi:hypothetical protein
MSKRVWLSAHEKADDYRQKHIYIVLMWKTGFWRRFEPFFYQIHCCAFEKDVICYEECDKPASFFGHQTNNPIQNKGINTVS